MTGYQQMLFNFYRQKAETDKNYREGMNLIQEQVRSELRARYKRKLDEGKTDADF